MFQDIIHHLFLFKTQQFTDWIPPSGETYSVRPNQYNQSLPPDLKTETESSL
jgi:hypothetical protein